MLGELRDAMHTLLCGLSKFERAGGRIRSRGQESTSHTVCLGTTVSDFSVGPVELVLTCGHLSVTVSWFYKCCLACLTEMVSYSILHGGVLQAVQAAASAASSFSLCFSNSIHTWIFCVLQ